MTRKKWTPNTEITESLIRFREKRKWQLGYRRYVLEKMPSEAYAPYFGLDIEMLRQWFELQFTDGLTWDNFGKAWQFDHIVPTTYFDYAKEEDLILCWSFINLRVERMSLEKNRGNRIELLAVRPYFQNLYNKTGVSICLKMLDKIATIENSPIEGHAAIENFLMANKSLIENISSFNHTEFNLLNRGMKVSEILLEKEILRKFGSR